jgi:hypothetical protein
MVMRSFESLGRWTFEVSTKHPHRKGWHDTPGYKYVDQLFTPEGRRVWVSFGGENVRKQTFPEIRDEEFLTVGCVSVEDDNTTTFNILSTCGNVIREVHSSTREREFVGEVLVSARLLEPAEIDELGELVMPLFSTASN